MLLHIASMIHGGFVYRPQDIFLLTNVNLQDNTFDTNPVSISSFLLIAPDIRLFLNTHNWSNFLWKLIRVQAKELLRCVIVLPLVPSKKTQ